MYKRQDLYKEFYIFYTTRPNSMSQKAGSEYEEIVITNYDPRLYNSARHWPVSYTHLDVYKRQSLYGYGG